ncbi:MAG TPA: NF038122 family metalloprotease [Blastocatellia bacterium]|nr:NF038122 family metalloprotease [Blastocatellia bacterium]
MKATYHNQYALFAIVFGCLLTTAMLSTAVQPAFAARPGMRQAAPPQNQQHDTTLAAGSVLELRDGQMACRPATKPEAQAMQRPLVQELHILRDESPRVEASEPKQQGLKIVLRATPQLEQFPAAKAAFLRAARAWEAMIQNPITVMIDVDYGPTNFGKPFAENAYGETRFQRFVHSAYYPTLRSRLIQSAGSPQEAALYNSLPAEQLPTDLGATKALILHVAPLRALGAIDPVADPEKETNFGLSPAIAFNSATNFDFDPSNGIAPKRYDFNAAAMHEIGHALGFFSGVGVNEEAPGNPPLPDMLDLFRFRPGITSTTLATTPRILSPGGEQVFFNGVAELAFSTGRQDKIGGDKQQAGHWKDDHFTGRYLGVMDPVFGWGRRFDLTVNDRAAFEALGYRTNPLPTPGEAELAADDGKRDDDAIGNGALVLNRLTPTSYPATLRKLRIMIPIPLDKSNPAGKPITLVYGYINSQSHFETQETSIPSVSNDLFAEFPIPNGPTINAGDFYVGYQVPTPHQGIAFAVDLSGSSFNRSIISTDNGKSFAQLAAVFQGKPATAMIRAIISTPLPPPPPPPTPTPTPTPGTVAITSGVPVEGHIARFDPYGVVSETQYTIQVPSGATQLKLELTGNTDVDLYANFGKRGWVEQTVPLADHSAVLDNHQESITITPNTSPALKEGVYYLMIASYGTAPASFNLTATVTGATNKATSVSAASYDGTALASEAIASAFGTKLATTTQVVPAGQTLPTQLGGTQVKVKDSQGVERAAPLFFVSPGQVNYLIPLDTALGTATVTVTSGDGTISVGTVQIVTVAPGLFTANSDGKGVPAAQVQRVKPNGSYGFEMLAQYDSTQRRFVPLPIDLNTTDQLFLILYGTGVRHQRGLSNVSATIGGVAVPVLYAGKQPDFIGLDQINLPLPRSLSGRGTVDVVLTVEGKTANTVTINQR